MSASSAVSRRADSSTVMSMPHSQAKPPMQFSQSTSTPS